MAVRTTPYAKEAIRSILTQTYADFELIAINNGGGEEVNKLLASFNDPRILVIENVEDVGLTRALNQGLASAQGIYIARMDDDDISLPERFAKQKAFLDTSPNIAAAGTAMTLIDPEGNSKGDKGVFTDPGIIRFRLTFANQLIHSSVMMRSEVLKAVGGYNEEFRYAQDLELWGRLSAAGYALSNISEPLLCYRMHGESVTQGKSRSLAYKFGIAAIRKNIERYLPLTDQEFGLFLRAFLQRRVDSFAQLKWVRGFWLRLVYEYQAKENLSLDTKKHIHLFIREERRLMVRAYLKGLIGK